MLNHTNARLLVFLSKIKFADWKMKDDDTKCCFTLLIHSLYDERRDGIRREIRLTKIRNDQDEEARVNEIEEERKAVIEVIEDYFQTKEPSGKQTTLYKWAINSLFHYLLDTKSKESN